MNIDYSLQKQTIQFSAYNVAQAVIAPPEADMHAIPAILRHLNIAMPRALILLAGGAQFSAITYKRLMDLFVNGIARIAIMEDATIIDGGTRAGIMKLIGHAMACRSSASRLLGVAPCQQVTYPGQPENLGPGDCVPLDPNHAHFVLVRSDQWGGETEMMYRLAAYVSQCSPSLAVLINGGAGARREVLYNVRQRRPVIIIEGSGRLADTLATHLREGTFPEDDAETVEILRDGRLFFFPASGSPDDFVDLATRLLSETVP